jgi:osmotically-inducible protein OsmY
MSTTDFELRKDIEAELDWDTRLDSRQIGVAVKNGIVTLSGYVTSYPQSRAAEQAAQAVAGVRAVANDIQVLPPHSQRRPDAELADAACQALRSNIAVPADAVKLIVHDGWVRLEGEVRLWAQRQAAESALINLTGVKGISNDIAVSSQASVDDVKTLIEQAIRRRAQLASRNIVVRSAEHTITLEGEVHSWDEREQAEAAARHAPGVTRVIDRLEVRPDGQ